MTDILEIDVEKRRVWDEDEEVFRYVGDDVHLKLCHSLISISNWEKKWKKAFLREEEKTFEETLDYIKCMTINGPFKDDVYFGLTDDQIIQITKYIEDPMTATWFSDHSSPSQIKQINNEIVTSELVYYWMLSFNVPVEFEKWHFNRLMTLIKICSIKNQPEKKMSKREIMEHNKALNEARRAKFHTKG